MAKTVLITGSTDGIGLATARLLLDRGHKVLLHGRNADKLAKVEAELVAHFGPDNLTSYVADLSKLAEVLKLAEQVSNNLPHLDALINNAGVFKTTETQSPDGLDLRFAVNTYAPYLLTKALFPLLGPNSRVINLSSAAQAPVDIHALAGRSQLTDAFNAYAQSKLALTIWSAWAPRSGDYGDRAPSFIAVNPGSMLASKMVKQGFGVAGNDISIGANVLYDAALGDNFSQASGQYFDNDIGQLSSPHSDAADPQKVADVISTLQRTVSDKVGI